MVLADRVPRHSTATATIGVVPRLPQRGEPGSAGGGRNDGNDLNDDLNDEPQRLLGLRADRSGRLSHDQQHTGMTGTAH